MTFALEEITAKRSGAGTIGMNRRGRARLPRKHQNTHVRPSTAPAGAPDY